MRHVDEGTLHALLDGALMAEDPERARAVERHLESCDDCRARLDTAADLRDRASDILAATGSVAPTGEGTAADGPEPDFDDVLARARADRGDRADPADPPDRAGGSAAGAAGIGAGGADADRESRRAWLPSQRLAWAATVVLALGTGYLMRDVIGPFPGEPEAALVQTEAADDPAGPADGPEAGPGAGAEAPQTAPIRSPAPTRSPAADDAEAGDAAPTPTPMAARAGEADRAADAIASTQRAEAEEASRGVPSEPVASAPPAEASPAEADPLADARADAAAAKLREAEAGPPVSGAAYGAAGGASWIGVPVDRARDLLGGPLYVLPRAELSEVYADTLGGQPRVMTLQLLGSGALIRVVQERGAGATGEDAALADAGAGEARPSAEAARPSAEAASPTPATPATRGREAQGLALPSEETVRVVRGPYVLELSGSLPGELLLILAESAVPAP